MAKTAKETALLFSSEGTAFHYTNWKNKKKMKGEKKLSLRKYDPVARKHVSFDEKKASKLKKKYRSPEALAEAAAKKAAAAKSK